MSNQIGKIPEFTKEESQEEVKEEKDTLSESSTEEKPTEESETISEQEAVKPEVKEEPSEDTDSVAKQIQGLSEQRETLLREIQELRGARREIKKEKLLEVETQLSEELTDIAPEDVAVIEKVLKAKGYVTKEEAKNLTYEDIKTQEVNKFLEKYPEYKPENDPNDLKWNSLNKIVSNFKRPNDARQIGQLLEMARRLSSPQQQTSGRDIGQLKKQMQSTALGSGGVQRSSNPSSLSDEQMQIYRNGGWTEEEIREIAKRKA